MQFPKLRLELKAICGFELVGESGNKIRLSRICAGCFETLHDSQPQPAAQSGLLAQQLSQNTMQGAINVWSSNGAGMMASDCYTRGKKQQLSFRLSRTENIAGFSWPNSLQYLLGVGIRARAMATLASTRLATQLIHKSKTCGRTWLEHACSYALADPGLAFNGNAGQRPKKQSRGPNAVGLRARGSGGSQGHMTISIPGPPNGRHNPKRAIGRSFHRPFASHWGVVDVLS